MLCNVLGLDKTVPQFVPKLSVDFSKHKWRLICSAQHHTLALDEDGCTYAVGRKEYGRLGLGENCEDAEKLTNILGLKDKSIVNISCSSATSFAVTDKGLYYTKICICLLISALGELFGWGMGTSGQLGTGSDEDCFEPTLIKSKQLIDKEVIAVGSGGQHTVILAITTNNNKGDTNAMDET